MNRPFVLRQLFIASAIGLAGGFIAQSLVAGFVIGLTPFLLMMALYPLRKGQLNENGKPKFDEREVFIDYRAARFSWAFLAIALGFVIMYFEFHLHQAQVPTQTLNGILMLAFGIYLSLRFWFRRA